LTIVDLPLSPEPGKGISTSSWDISLQRLTEEKDFALSPEALAVTLNFLVDCI